MVEWSKNGGFPFFSLNNIDFFCRKGYTYSRRKTRKIPKILSKQSAGRSGKNQFFGLGLRLFRFEKWGNTMVGKLTQRLHKSKNGKKGFTLVELIVVIVIILILAAVMVPLLMNYIGQANQANAKSNASTVLTQIQADYAASEAGKYTGVEAPGTGNYTKINDVNVSTPANGNAATAGTTTPSAAYAVNTVTRTGGTQQAPTQSTSKYKEIVAFSYFDGSYAVTWTMDDGWTVKAQNTPAAATYTP